MFILGITKIYLKMENFKLKQSTVSLDLELPSQAGAVAHTCNPNIWEPRWADHKVTWIETILANTVKPLTRLSKSQLVW